jgi:hypothetical protein
MQTKYKIEFFQPKSVLLPLVEKMLSLDDHLIDLKSIIPINKGDSKLRTLSNDDRGFLQGQKWLKRPKKWEYGDPKCGYNQFMHSRDAYRLISCCISWLGLKWCARRLGFNEYLMRGFSNQHRYDKECLQRLIRDYLIFPNFNAQYEKWLKETTPKYRAIGYQFCTVVDGRYLLTDAQSERQERTLYPNWHLLSRGFSVCFEPIPK